MNPTLPNALSHDVHFQFASYFFNDELSNFAYVLSQKLEEGHICVSLDEVMEAEVFMGAREKEKTAIKKRFLEHPNVSINAGIRKPFVVYNDRLYLHRYFNYETIILNRIKKLIESESDCLAEREQQLQANTALIGKLFKNGNAGKSPDWQLAAALSAVLNNFTIITGGPGTGKTTTVAKVLALLYASNPQLKVALAAPTGKAAARMAESLKFAVAGDNPNRLGVEDYIAEQFLKLVPGTIHRLLKPVINTCHFQHNSEHPLAADVVIVDESSMIDVALFAKLLAAIGNHSRLIMLGDKDQLASVEAGSLFGDLCQALPQLNQFSLERAKLINSFSGKDCQLSKEYITSNGHPLFQHIIELRKSHRFSDKEGIGRFSKAVIKNNTEDISSFANNTDHKISIDEEYSEALFEQFVAGYRRFIEEADLRQALRNLNLLRVLCATKEGDQGLYNLNKRIENYLHRKGIISKTGEYYINRPVMVTKNMYHLGLFNGDVGIIRPDTESGVIKAWFEGADGSLNGILPGYLTDVETVYAMTIHKSQGSEFNEVLVVLPNNANHPLLTRELLYTAVSRAKTRAFIQAPVEVILATAKGCVNRASGISQRFN